MSERQKKPKMVKKTVADITGRKEFDFLDTPAFDWGNEPDEKIPADRHYSFWNTELIEMFGLWMQQKTGDGFYIYGPTGAGKSDFVRAWCAKAGLPMEEVTGHRRMSYSDFIGQFVVFKDGMAHMKGPLARAYKYGRLFAINELDRVDPTVTTVLHGVMDGEPMMITENGGELVQRHPNFRFIATGNTSGNGEDTHLYPGAMRMDRAFIDRFWKMKAKYPPAAVEVDIIMQEVQNVPKFVVECAVNLANEVRAVACGEQSKLIKDLDPNTLDITITTRSLIRWMKIVSSLNDVYDDNRAMMVRALNAAMLNSANTDSRLAIIGLFERVFPDMKKAA